MTDDIVYTDANTLENFMKDVFKGLGVPEKDASLIANFFDP